MWRLHVLRKVLRDWGLVEVGIQMRNGTYRYDSEDLFRDRVTARPSEWDA